jgi:hypothetical protein
LQSEVSQECLVNEKVVWERVDSSDGVCAGCGQHRLRVFRLDGEYYCEVCRGTMD